MKDLKHEKISESFFEKIKRYNKTVQNAIDANLLPADISKAGKIGLFLDFMKEYLFHGAYLQDYLQYDFYWKNRRDRDRYVVHGKLVKMMQICNNPKHRYIIEQKPEFDKCFKDFLQRSFLNMSDATEEEFRDFINNKESFFVKQPDGEFGTGVAKVYSNDILDFSATYNEYRKKCYLLEETLTQCKEMQEFNDTSINTLRIVTIRKADGNVEVVGGLVRLGRKGHIADNFHHMGIAAFLDTCGIVSALGVDRNFDRYVVHPDSGKKIVGFEVPVWDKVQETVCRAAQVVPDMRYIGWDVVITEDYKVALVEGNSGADPDAEQISSGKGRWPVYWNLIKDINAKL